MKKGLTELVFIVDKSGSMSGLESDTIGGFNSMLKEQQGVAGEAVVTTVLFSDRVKLLHDRLDIQAVAPLTDEDYSVGGNTALLDALGAAMHKVKESRRNMRKEFLPEKVMFVFITDGEENASRHYTAKMIRERIEKFRKMGWEFIFFGANMDSVTQAGTLGISADRAFDYFSDSVGTRSAYSEISAISSAIRTGAAVPKSGANDVKNALGNLKNIVGNLRDSLSDLTSDISEINAAAENNGGSIADVNEIMRDFFNRKSKED